MQELFINGLWLLGVIIFCTSIAIPAVKIMGMGWLLWSVVTDAIVSLFVGIITLLFVIDALFPIRFITEIGRWSNVDPFAITVFVPLMTFGTLASSDAGWGSTAFIAVVILTLLGTMTFDSRLLWDAAEERKIRNSGDPA